MNIGNKLNKYSDIEYCYNRLAIAMGMFLFCMFETILIQYFKYIY